MPVTFERVEPEIGLLTIRRPEVLNALNWEAMDAFAAAVNQARQAEGLRALVLTGAGDRAFCAGGDLRELHGAASYADGERLAHGMAAALDMLEALPFPTIAAMQGLARGGGVEIALACDMRILAEEADLGFAQIRLGLTPGWGGGPRLLRLVGYARALEWLSSGRVLHAREALTHGLVNHVVPAARVLPAAWELAHSIAANPPAAVQAVKSVLQLGLAEGLPAAYAAEQQFFPELWASPEHQARAAAFFHRR